MATRRRLPPPVDDEVDDLPELPEMVPQNNRKTLELDAAMAARLKGKPRFPFPGELREVLRPHWLEIVNSFPADHFQISDVPLLKVWCRCAYDVERTSLLIEDEGEVIMGGRGPITNPRVKIRTDAQMMMLSLSAKFRNQPSSRTNADNFKGRQGKAARANTAAQEMEESDGLLAGGTRH